MGYCYTKGGALVCDRCNGTGGVRKRTCTHKVTHTSTTGQRVAVPYCQPPALCKECFDHLGGSKAIHARCASLAAESQARQDEREARIAAGGHLVNGRWGDWYETVPEGMVGACYRGTDGARWVLVDYSERSVDWLEDTKTAIPWIDHPERATKRVA